MKNIFALGFALAIAGCASTSITPISQNQFLLSTSAAPACGRTGAVKVAAKMAAVETIRRGYKSFVILGAGSQSNVSAISTGPTYAQTSGTYNSFGNTTYGNATTNFGGGGVMFVGTNDADLRVLMLNPGDQGFSQAIDAKSQLGEKWAELVEKGVDTCTG